MVEIIGFIISLLALIYLFIKQNLSPQRQDSTASYSEQEMVEDDPFQEFLKAVEKEKAAREAAQRLPPPPPPPKIKKEQKKAPVPLSEYRLASQIENRRLKSTLEERRLKASFKPLEELPGHLLNLSEPHLFEEQERRGPSRARAALQRLATRQEMIIYQEILDKPKSLRS